MRPQVTQTLWEFVGNAIFLTKTEIKIMKSQLIPTEFGPPVMRQTPKVGSCLSLIPLIDPL